MGSGSSASKTAVLASVATAAATSPVAFSPSEFRPFKLSKITPLSHNTKAYEVELPSPEHEMGANVASFILVKGATDTEGNFPVRPYTPTTLNDVKGSFELVVKSYPSGTVSSYLDGLKVGDSIEVKGPINKIPVTVNMKEEIGMLAGGTGITPMLQVLREILKHPEDTTKLHLVFANHSEEDILLKGTIDSLVQQHGERLKVTYVLSQPKSVWNGFTGHVNADIIARTMPVPSDKHLVLVCGPPGFMETISGNKNPDKSQGPLTGLLKDAGFTEDMVVKF